MSSQEALQKQLSELISDQTYSNYPQANRGRNKAVFIDTSREELEAFYTTGKTNLFSGHVVAIQNGLEFFNAIGRRTINISGNLGTVKKDTDEKSWTTDWDITLNQPRITLYDKYDWDGTSEDGMGVTMGILAPRGTRSYLDKLGLANIGVGIRDADMARLQDPRINLGYPFKINGQIDVGDSFNFKIHDRYLPRKSK